MSSLITSAFAGAGAILAMLLPRAHISPANAPIAKVTLSREDVDAASALIAKNKRVEAPPL